MGTEFLLYHIILYLIFIVFMVVICCVEPVGIANF